MSSLLPRRRNGRMQGTPHGGFTLMELLVVIGIIGLLLGLLIPSLVSARRETRRIVCQANLKQVVFGWHGFLEENKGAFPRAALADVNYGGRQGLLAIYQKEKKLNKHLKLPAAVQQGAEVFSCPDDTGGGADPNQPKSQIAPSFFRWYGTSFLANPLLAGPTPFALGSDDPCNKSLSAPLESELPNLRSDQVDHPSRLLLVADGVWQKAWNYSNREPVQQWHVHRQKYNVGFMDGHADFAEIRKGIYVSAQYTVLPTARMQNLALPNQAEPKTR